MKKGFTLIELLAVVLVLGILTSIALPQYQRSIERARAAEAPSILRSLFDSRERVAVERGYHSYNAMPVKFGFTKLDIAIKGQLSNGTASTGTLVTKDFEYKLLGPTNQATMVSGKLLRGKYTGLILTYNGSEFGCTPPAGQANACSVLGY